MYYTIITKGLNREKCVMNATSINLDTGDMNGIYLLDPEIIFTCVRTARNIPIGSCSYNWCNRTLAWNENI